MQPVIVIGAGIGGLAAALRLAGRGIPVTVLERHGAAGGKLRTVATAAGPCDAGPTVMTLPDTFEAMFADVGERLEDHLELESEPLLARHFWPDGSRLDLHSDLGASLDAVRAFGGDETALQFERFCGRSKRLFDAFRDPVMRAAEISPTQLAKQVVRGGLGLARAMGGIATLNEALAGQFADIRLQQLFGRYATYVGGSPQYSPALLMLIWQAELNGVYRVVGGMHTIARSLQGLAEQRGAEFRFDADVAAIEQTDGRVSAVRLQSGETLPAGAIVFNGDPRALRLGKLGPACRQAVNKSAVSPRSHAAYVWSFAADPGAFPLAHHNVFFSPRPNSEFEDIARGEMPSSPSLYICAEDRGTGRDTSGLERFEIIMNAPAAADGAVGTAEEREQCRERTFDSLARFGLSFSPSPSCETLTAPTDFERLFPGSGGSLYGRSPHGMQASFARPKARSRIPGLYLAGGGTHPGPGIPMALTSGRHAAAAIENDLGLTSASTPTATPGGTSTASPMMANARSR